MTYTFANLSYWMKFWFLVAPTSLQKALIICGVYPRLLSPYQSIMFHSCKIYLQINHVRIVESKNRKFQDPRKSVPIIVVDDHVVPNIASFPQTITGT